MAEKPSLQQRMAQLRSRYRQTLPQRSLQLRELWHTLRRSVWDESAAEDIGALAHRLAGSGKTFGFAELSEAAHEVDVDCARLLNQPRTPSLAELLELERSVGTLLAKMDAPRLSRRVESRQEEPKAEAPAVSGVKPLIAIIDDDDELRELMTLRVRAVGYEVASFASPEAALQTLDERVPSLVVLDLFYPGKHQPALDTISEIRSHTGVRVPVLVISAMHDFTSRVSAARAGADLFMGKPFDEEELVSAVTRLALPAEPEPLRCLVVDDDDMLAMQVRYWLEDAGVEPALAGSAREAWVMLEDFRPDVVLSDINMPDCTGLELAAMLRQTPGFTRMPVIFMTAGGSADAAQHGRRPGAEEHLHKPLNRDQVVGVVIRRGNLSRRASKHVERVIKRSESGLGMSRYGFYSELDKKLSTRTGGGRHSALVICALDSAATMALADEDIDRAALSWHFSRRIENSGLRRWSLIGDFTAAMLLDVNNHDEHRRFATRVRQLVSCEPFVLGDRSISSDCDVALLHLSAGEEVASRKVMLQVEQLLSLAVRDKELAEGYLSADLGVPSPPADQFRQRLSLAYQPVVTIDGSGPPVSAVYVRMKDGQGNLLPAESFIEDLRRRGAMPDLDAWVARQAHAALQLRDRRRPYFLLVQISDESMKSGEYLARVTRLLEQSPMTGADFCLVLGVSERAAITCRGAVERLNIKARETGAALMLTDYGGSSESMELLESLRPLFARLAKTVSRRLASGGAFSPSDRSLMDTARQAECSVIAGSVETASALSALWSRGVRRFQGYFIQAPSRELEDNELPQAM